jgi:DNA-binding response OmpR family regulator
MHVLIVEDNVALGHFLKKGLQLEGHAVEWVSDGEAALKCAAAHRPELMVLDLGLPRLDGVQVLDALRGQGGDTSVLVLTGRNDTEERVRCLNAGADDYLQKPFSFPELAARCGAILRRRGRFEQPVLAEGGIEMNLLTRGVQFRGVSVELTGKEFQLLEALLRGKGRCCTRRELLREVWPGTPESGSNVVDVYVNYLRRKLGAVPGVDLGGEVAASVIETVRGTGYRVRGPGTAASQAVSERRMTPTA